MSINTKQAEVMNRGDLLTKEAVAKHLQVSTRTIDRLITIGALPVVRLGRRIVRFRRQALNSALDRLETAKK